MLRLKICERQAVVFHWGSNNSIVSLNLKSNTLKNKLKQKWVFFKFYLPLSSHSLYATFLAFLFLIVVYLLLITETTNTLLNIKKLKLITIIQWIFLYYCFQQFKYYGGHNKRNMTACLSNWLIGKLLVWGFWKKLKLLNSSCKKYWSLEITKKCWNKKHATIFKFHEWKYL